MDEWLQKPFCTIAELCHLSSKSDRSEQDTMRYSLLRLFLASREEGTIFSQIPPRRSRQQYIREVFGSEIRFQHYQGDYVYRPFESPHADFLVGLIAREHPIIVGGPPEEKFVHKEMPNWETANVLINAPAEENGQIVAMQSTIGQPISIFRSLADHINASYPGAEWLIAVNPITSREQFWTVAERYAGHIKEIDFEFSVPNIWGGQSETEKALRELKEKNNAQEVDVKIKNKDGKLNPDSTRVRESVEYTARGGGISRIRDDSDAVVFSSDREESIITTPAITPDPPI